MIDQQIHLLKVGWQLKNRDSESFPYFLYQFKSDSEDSSLKRLYLTSGMELNYRISNEKYCIGFEPNKGAWRTCPESNKIEKGLYCPSCERDDFFSCRKMCQGFYCNPKTVQAKALCDINETVLYLTYVGGKYKVGVSLNPMRRWIEQGSYFGTILTKGNGLTVRFYETTISQQLDLKLSVNNNAKMKFIGENTQPIEDIKERFNEIFKDVKKLDLFEPNSAIKIVDLRSHYHQIPYLKRSVIIDNRYISGTVISVLGKIVVVKDKASYYATDLSKALGRVLIPVKKIKRQRTLFDY